MLRTSLESSRWQLAWSMIRAMIWATVPAILALWGFLTLLDLARAEGGFGAWAGLIILAPVAFLLTAVAVTVDFFSTLGLIATLLSRRIKTIHVSKMGMSRPIRDVTPEKPKQPESLSDSPQP